MLQRLRPGSHCLWFLVALATTSVIGFQMSVIWAQTASGETVSPEKPSQGTGVGKPADCGELAVLVQQERTAIFRELGQVKREIAALREDLSKPGVKEIFAGIGYIFGLAGVGLYAHCRRNKAMRPGAGSREG